MAKKQPKLVLRESAVADVSRGWAPGAFLDMGAGTGHMSRIFLERGFSGASYDLGEDSRRMIRANLAEYGERIRVVDDAAELDTPSFDFLLAFEVLEHIDDDAGALAAWLKALKPGGRVLITVPAHARKYGRSDELVGHVRRYERAELQRLMQSCGLDDIRIINYGYPITELTRRLSNRLVKSDQSYEGMSAVDRSVRSAQAQPPVIARWLKYVGGGMFTPFCVVQRWFYRFDLGDGLVATAVKR